MVRLIKLLLFLVVPIIAVAAFFFLDSMQMFNVEQIGVALHSPQGINTEMEKEVKASLGEQTLKMIGKKIWQIHLSDLQELNHSWIADLRARKILPNRLELDVDIKNFSAMLFSHSGKLIPIDENGNLLDPIDIKWNSSQPLFIGANLEREVDLRKKALKVLAEIPDKGLFSKESISELRFERNEGFWATLTKGGIRVKLGEEDISTKSERVAKVLEYLKNHSIQTRVIDANLNKKVLVKTRKGP